MRTVVEPASRATPSARGSQPIECRGRRLVYAVTHPVTARAFLRGQLRYMQEQGLEVTLVCGPGPDAGSVAASEDVPVMAVPLEREIRVAADFSSLARLTRLFRSLAPDLVNAGTPKAGVLGMLAATAARVPVRVYLLRGLRLETKRGLQRSLLAALERAAAASAHRVICVSESLRRAAIQRGLVPQHKAVVLGAGSSNGIDASRFCVTEQRRQAASALRGRLGIPPAAPVVGYVGRLTRDKGIAELLEAFELLLRRWPEARLLLVGEAEAADGLPADVADRMLRHPRVVLAGATDDPAPCYATVDVLAFPSRREGMPNVPLEAAAAGRPVVGFNVTGTVDAVVDGQTGCLVPPGDVAAFSKALDAYLARPELRQRHGQAGRERVEREFAPLAVWSALLEEYDSLAARRLGARSPS